jgi:hypothetical protein
VAGAPRKSNPEVRGVARRRDDGGDGGGLPARRGAPRRFSLPGTGERRAVGAGLRGPAGGGDRAGSRDPVRRNPVRPPGRGAGPPRRPPFPHVRHPFRAALVPDPDARLPSAGATAFPAPYPVGGREEPFPRGGTVGRRLGRLDRRSLPGCDGVSRAGDGDDRGAGRRSRSRKSERGDPGRARGACRPRICGSLIIGKSKQPISGGHRCGPTRSRRDSYGRPTAAC